MKRKPSNRFKRMKFLLLRKPGRNRQAASSDPVQQGHLAALLECRPSLNPHTQHLRILDIVQNISQTPGIHHNSTIIALPYLGGELASLG